jgi:carboxypeptidase C (cathepsin A)
LNGGPGASSLGFGYLTELGPFYVDETAATGSDSAPNTPAVPTLVANPTAWTTVANVIFLESPAGVGFSYCSGNAPLGVGKEGKPNPSCEWTDSTTASLNYAAVQAFFAAFPEYASNPFHIWGESYGGIYVPMLADLLLNGACPF